MFAGRRPSFATSAAPPMSNRRRRMRARSERERADDAFAAGFYPQPRYEEFDRAPGLAYDVYADEDVVDALLDPRALYSADFTALVGRPHYEFKFASRASLVAELVERPRDTAVVVAWYRRPLRYARALPAFPWREGHDLVLFSRAAHEPAVVATLLAYAERADGSSATGYASLDVTQVDRQLPGVRGDVRRAQVNDDDVD
jgi:hypothetical protein